MKNPVTFLVADLPRVSDCVNHISVADFECCGAQKSEPNAATLLIRHSSGIKSQPSEASSFCHA